MLMTFLCVSVVLVWVQVTTRHLYARARVYACVCVHGKLAVVFFEHLNQITGDQNQEAGM